jgi:hypothetical protein
MPAQTLVFSEQFTSACVFRTRTIGLLECFTLSLGWQWSALSTLFPGLDFLTAFSLSLSSHPSESSSLPLPLLGSLSEAHSHSLVTSLSLSLARSLTLTPPPPFIFFLFWVLSRSLAFFLVHSLSPGSGSSFLSHSYLSGLTVSSACAHAARSLWSAFSVGSISSQCHTVLLYSVLPLEPLYPNLSGLALSRSRSQSPSLSLAQSRTT